MTFGTNVKVKIIYNQAVWLVMLTPLTVLTEDIQICHNVLIGFQQWPLSSRSRSK